MVFTIIAVIVLGVLPTFRHSRYTNSILFAHTERHLWAEGVGGQVGAYRSEVLASVLEVVCVLFIDAKASGASIQGQRCSGSASFHFLLAVAKQGRSSATLGSNIVDLAYPLQSYI